MVKDDERMISTWERKILRRIYGPKFENGEWQSRGNMELYDLYQEPQIVGVIKSSRLRWAGHTERSEENSLLSRIYRGHPGGKRCVGRPRKKCIEDVNRGSVGDGSTDVEKESTGQRDMGADCEAGF